MKKLNTVTEYQLLFLARQELSRRIDELKTAIIRKETTQSKRRSESLLNMYCEQMREIVERMAEINKEHENGSV
jgi:hypothetical protein